MSASEKLSVRSAFMHITEPTPEKNGLYLANAYNLLVFDEHKNYEFYDSLKYAWHVLTKNTQELNMRRGNDDKKQNTLAPLLRSTHASIL